MSGIEDIIGRVGKYSMIEKYQFLKNYILSYERVNNTYLKPIFAKKFKASSVDSSKIINAFKKVAYQEAMAIAQDPFKYK